MQSPMPPPAPMIGEMKNGSSREWKPQYMPMPWHLRRPFLAGCIGAMVVVALLIGMFVK